MRRSVTSDRSTSVAYERVAQVAILRVADDAHDLAGDAGDGDAAAEGRTGAEEVARERLVDDRGFRGLLAVAVIELAAGDERGAERGEIGRPDDVKAGAVRFARSRHVAFHLDGLRPQVSADRQDLRRAGGVDAGHGPQPLDQRKLNGLAALIAVW